MSNDALGWTVTAMAFTLNFILQDSINQTLTIVVSGMSVVYLILKIEEKIYNRKNRKKDAKPKP